MEVENAIMRKYDFNPRLLLFNRKLTNAIEDNNKDDFESALNGIDDENVQNAIDCSGASLLHVAAANGSVGITKYLISRGLNVNLHDTHGRTSLMIALKKYHFALIKVLLEASADILACDVFGYNALRIAIELDPILSIYGFVIRDWPLEEYWQIVGMILDKLDNIYSSNSDKIANELLQANCPLTHVVFMNNSEVMKIMLERGSSTCKQHPIEGSTALHLAVRYLKVDKVKLLLDYNADLNILDYDGYTPLMLNCVHNRIPTCGLNTLKILMQHKSKMFTTNTPSRGWQFQGLFRHGSQVAVRIALENYPDLLVTDFKDNISLMHDLCTNLNPGIVEVIRDQTIDVHKVDRHGWTPLATAADYCNCDMVEFLLIKGANPNVGIYCGTIPLFMPFRFADLQTKFEVKTMLAHLKSAKLMLEFGGNPDIRCPIVGTLLNKVVDKQVLVLAEPVLSHLAIRQILQIPISDVNRKIIEEDMNFQEYFNKRLKQLEEAKTSMICGAVTLFDFLTANDETISLYARNRLLALKLLNLSYGKLQMDSYYVDILYRRASKVSTIVQSRKVAANIICHNIGKLYECNSVITWKIIDYLDDEDVQKLVL